MTPNWESSGDDSIDEEITLVTLSEQETKAGDEYLLNLVLTPAGQDNPAPWYKKLREEFPLFTSSTGAIFLTRYEDCRAVLRDNRFGNSDRRGSSGSMFAVEEADDIKEYREQIMKRRRESPRSLLFLNPPDHTRLRGLVSRAFTPRRIEGMRESIVALTEECLDNLAERGSGDAIDILGYLPVNVIGELVGVPPRGLGTFSPPRHCGYGQSRTRRHVGRTQGGNCSIRRDARILPGVGGRAPDSPRAKISFRRCWRSRRPVIA